MTRTTIYVTAAGVLIDATIVAYAQAGRTQGGAQWLTALLLGAAGLVATCGAAGAAFSAAWGAVSAGRYRRLLEQRRAADVPPSQARGPVPCPPSARYDEYWVAARAASAAAEAAPVRGRHAGSVGNESGPAESARTIGYTAVLPLPDAGDTWGFDGTPGSRVVEPLGGPWTATVAEPVGRVAA